MGGSPVPLAADGSVPPFLPAGRVREIVGWSGDAVNGVQVVYDVQGDAVRGPKRMGDHGLYRQSNFVLDVEGGEVGARALPPCGWSVRQRPGCAHFCCFVRGERIEVFSAGIVTLRGSRSFSGEPKG